MTTNQKRRLLIGSAGALGLGMIGVLKAQSDEKVIKIVAKKFEYVPRTIEVKKGESVVLEFSAPDVTMGANFLDFKMRTDIVPGQVATLHLTPDKVGKFDFFCDVDCGEGHEEMDGVLIVS